MKNRVASQYLSEIMAEDMNSKPLEHAIVMLLDKNSGEFTNFNSTTETSLKKLKLEKLFDISHMSSKTMSISYDKGMREKVLEEINKVTAPDTAKFVKIYNEKHFPIAEAIHK
jgi:hypothetical protein